MWSPMWSPYEVPGQGWWTTGHPDLWSICGCLCGPSSCRFSVFACFGGAERFGFGRLLVVLFQWLRAVGVAFGFSQVVSHRLGYDFF